MIPSTLRSKVLEQIHEGPLGHWKMYAQGKRLCILAWNFQWYQGGCGEMWHLSSQLQVIQTNWKCEWCASSHMAYVRHRFCSIGIRLITWWLEITSPSTWSLEDYPNSSTHTVIKELGLVFTELGRPFVLRSGQWTLLQFEGISQLPEFLSGGPHHQQPTLSTKQWIHWSFGGHRQEADGQIFERGKTVEFWSSTVPDHSNLIYTPISIRDVDREESHIWTLPQVPSSIGHNMDTSRIRKELLRRQPATTSTSTGATELEPGQPVFVKEVHGNIWRTATINQPACWTRFLLGQVSRQLHLEKDQINDQTKGLYLLILSFRLKHNRWTLKEKPVHVLIHPSTSWMDSQCCPVMPTTSVTTPATIDRDSQVSAIPDPITGATSPTSDRGSAPSPVTTPRHSTRSTKGFPPVCYTPSRKW